MNRVTQHTTPVQGHVIAAHTAGLVVVLVALVGLVAWAVSRRRTDRP
jgi:hypothetical protein